jgi:hypothetical protein
MRQNCLVIAAVALIATATADACCLFHCGPKPPAPQEGSPSLWQVNGSDIPLNNEMKVPAGAVTIRFLVQIPCRPAGVMQLVVTETGQCFDCSAGTPNPQNPAECVYTGTIPAGVLAVGRTYKVHVWNCAAGTQSTDVALTVTH